MKINTRPSSTRLNAAIEGFTLIELSIVLVIIGLIVGSILVGQDLIHAAHIRAQVTQIEKFNTAANTFQTKYNALPGDMTPTLASEFGFASRAGGAGRGDGNGLIEGGASNSWWFAGEVVLFWNDLSMANMVEGNYVGADCATNGSCIATSSSVPITALTPPTKLDQRSIVAVYANNGVNYWQITGPDTVTSAGNMECSDHSPNNGCFFSVTPLTAQQIDQKIDDGYPTTGAVQSTGIGSSGTNGPGNSTPGAAGAPSADDCGNSSVTPTSYNVGSAYANTQVCTISIRAQF